MKSRVYILAPFNFCNRVIGNIGELLEVGASEKGHFVNFLMVTELLDNSLNHSEFQLLFDFVWFWKISLFFIQVGTNLAQAHSVWILQYSE